MSVTLLSAQVWITAFLGLAGIDLFIKKGRSLFAVACFVFATAIALVFGGVPHVALLIVCAELVLLADIALRSKENEGLDFRDRIFISLLPLFLPVFLLTKNLSHQPDILAAGYAALLVIMYLGWPFETVSYELEQMESKENLLLSSRLRRVAGVFLLLAIMQVNVVEWLSWSVLPLLLLSLLVKSRLMSLALFSVFLVLVQPSLKEILPAVLVLIMGGALTRRILYYILPLGLMFIPLPYPPEFLYAGLGVFGLIWGLANSSESLPQPKALKKYDWALLVFGVSLLIWPIALILTKSSVAPVPEHLLFLATAVLGELSLRLIKGLGKIKAFKLKSVPMTRLIEKVPILRSMDVIKGQHLWHEPQRPDNEVRWSYRLQIDSVFMAALVFAIFIWGIYLW